MDFQANFEGELQKHKDEAASKVEVVLKRLEEQGRMIESLHSSVSLIVPSTFFCNQVNFITGHSAQVAMYKRLYEEELKVPASLPLSAEHCSGFLLIILFYF